MLREKFDSDFRLLCDKCQEFIEPEEPKVILGLAARIDIEIFREINWLEVYHKDCAPKRRPKNSKP